MKTHVSQLCLSGAIRGLKPSPGLLRHSVADLLAVVFLGLVPLCAGQDRPAQVYRADPETPLTGPSTARPFEVVVGFLSTQGVSPATLETLRLAGEHRVAATGVTHIRLRQEVSSLWVYDAHVKAAVSERGELLFVVETLAEVSHTGVRPARIDHRQALRAALDRLYSGRLSVPSEAGTEGNTVIFGRGAGFHTGPRVAAVAIPHSGGSMQAGFLVETWSEERNLLHETLVGGDGVVLSIQLRTNEDSYNVFPVDPGKTPQTIVAGPGDGNVESPIGWLFPGLQRTIDISGNNVHAYLDADADDDPDSGGAFVADRNFLTPADLETSPSTPENRNVAVQNLFFLNNVIHDRLYRHGFTETAGNFQEDNFGLGGRDGDSVFAEAQDGSGTDNANFATPRDGLNPRMQMFLWTGKGDHQVEVHEPEGVAGTYPAQGAEFGPPLDPVGLLAEVVLADDGTGTTSDGCEAILSDVADKIALIDRGTCTFVVKVKNAQTAGAIAVIVANNAGDSIITMGGDDPTIAIPSVFVGQSDGNTLKNGLPGLVATVRRTDPPPLQRDGDLDSDIVWHEYGHGLTWRMIGRMSGPLAGAVGEGVSDLLSILINEDDVVGEYSFDDPAGIRRYPYTNYPLTYGDVTGAEVHDDGEVYAAIGWKLWEIFQRENLSKNLLLDYVVDGMNYTPAAPAFEDMRDGMLQAVATGGWNRKCLVWEAFAALGVGVGAEGLPRGNKVVVTESFALPLRCKGR